MSGKNKRRQQQRRQAPPLHRPDTREVAVAQVTDKYSDYPSNGLTPVRLAEIFKEADAGDILRQAELFEEMEEKDPHLFSQLQTRKNAVTGLDFEIIPFDSDDERDKEIAEFVEAQINGIEGFGDIMLDLLDAIGKGFAVSEIMWAYEGGHVVVSDIRSRYQKRFFCLYGKGPIRAAFNVQHDMRVARMKWGENAAVIKIDVKKFFYSIDRDILKKLLAKRFKKLKKQHPELYEEPLRFYRLLCKVIDSSPEGETGVPLGNVSSQDFANITLNELDQFCIRFLGAKLYTRYADDAVIIAPDKETARKWLAKIKQFVKKRLHLDLNSKTKIFYMRQGVNAYGYKIKATHLELRTESKRKEKRKVKAMIEKLREGKKTRREIQQEVNSWLGFARWASAYNLAKKIFVPYRFIKVEGVLPYGAISRNRAARRVLQQRHYSQTAHKAVAA